MLRKALLALCVLALTSLAAATAMAGPYDGFWR